jgi:hypothetical protein
MSSLLCFQKPLDYRVGQFIVRDLTLGRLIQEI